MMEIAIEELRERYPETVAAIETGAVKKYLDTQRCMVDRITFYRTYWEAMRSLPKAQQARFIQGLLDYVFTGVVPEFDGALNSLFIGIRPNIDNSIEAVLTGKQGGRPRKNSPAKTKAPAALIETVINHLNEKTGKRFRPSASAAIKNISARAAEGFTQDDFIAVIDNMTKRWKGTSNEIYLRPETLFGAKMDGYLNTSGAKAGGGFEQYN